MYPSSERVAAADPPANPDPTTIAVNLRLFAGLMRAESILCFSHFESMGPEGILDSGVEISSFTGERPLTIKQQIELDMQKAKANAWSALSTTDWYFVRKIETGKEVPEEIKNQRQSIKNSLEEHLSVLQEELKNEL